MDVAYVRGWSLGLDLRLFFRTPLQLLPRAGRRERDANERVRGPSRGRRARLLGPEPRPQPPGDPRRASSVALCDLSRERLERIGRRYPAAR